MHYDLDQLSVPHFAIDDPAVSAALTTETDEFIVIPQNLNFRTRIRGGSSDFLGPTYYSIPAREELYLESAVAVVASSTNAIVWTGVISSARHEFKLGSTVVEQEIHDWFFDLLNALGRPSHNPQRSL